MKKKEVRARPASPALIRSPDELRAELPDAWVARAGDNSHVAIDITTRVQELSVIEDVEEFGGDLERLSFGNGNSLGYAHIEIVDARPVEESPVCCPESSESTVLDKGSHGRSTRVRISGRGRCGRQEVASRGSERSIAGRTIGIEVARIQYLNLAYHIWHIG